YRMIGSSCDGAALKVAGNSAERSTPYTACHKAVSRMVYLPHMVPDHIPTRKPAANHGLSKAGFVDTRCGCYQRSRPPLRFARSPPRPPPKPPRPPPYPPRPPPKPLRCSRGRASLTVSDRPPCCVPCSAAMAASASPSSAISTNPNPLLRPVSRSAITSALLT